MRRMAGKMVLAVAAMFVLASCGEKKVEEKKEVEKKAEQTVEQGGEQLAATPEEAMKESIQSQLPPGHPPIPGMNMAMPKGELPPGHPPIGDMMKARAQMRGEAAPAEAAPAEAAPAEAAPAEDNLLVATYSVPGLNDDVAKQLTLALAGRTGVVAAKADVEAGLFKVTYSSGCPNGMKAALQQVVPETSLVSVTNRTGDAPAKSGCGGCPNKATCGGSGAE